MNIKERLDKSKKKTSRSIKTKSDKFINEIFRSNDNLDKLICDLINSSDNILFVSGVDCDNSIIAAYIKNHIKAKESFCILDEISVKSEVADYKRVIIPNAGIVGFVNLFELVLTGYNGFVLGLNLQDYDDIIEILQTLIMINYPNLSLNQINRIIYSVNPVVIYFKKDDDGLFVIRSVDKINKKNGKLYLENKYSVPDINNEYLKHDKIEDNNIKTDNTLSSIVQSQIKQSTDDIEQQKKVYISEFIDNKDQQLDNLLLKNENVPKIESSNNKINKYKLLKEKIKKHKEDKNIL